MLSKIFGRLRARDKVPGAGSRSGPPPSLRSSLPRIWRQVPEAFLKACCLWTARVVNCLWRPLVGPSLGTAWALSGVGPEGGQEADGPRPRHAHLSQGPLLPCVSSHFSPHKGSPLRTNPALCEPGSLLGPRGPSHCLPRSPGSLALTTRPPEQFPEARPTSGHEASLARLASGRSTQACRSARRGSGFVGSGRQDPAVGQGLRSRRC